MKAKIIITPKKAVVDPQGKTVQEVLAAKLTAPYDAKTAGGTDASADRFISAVYQQLKAGK